MKVRRIITLKGWVDGVWTYEQIYSDQIIEVEGYEIDVMPWIWWDEDAENSPKESDTQIIVQFYAVDADEEPLITHRGWASAQNLNLSQIQTDLAMRIQNI